MMILAGMGRREMPRALSALVLSALAVGTGCGRSELLARGRAAEAVDGGDSSVDRGQDASPEVKREAGREVGPADGRRDGGGSLSLLAGGLGGQGNQDGVGGAARFNAPWGAASDGAGNLFVTDSGNHTIRKVVLATGAVTTFAGSKAGSQDGTGTGAGFNGPSGIVSDGAGNLFVVDSGNYTIRKVVIATGQVTTLAGLAGQRGSDDGTGPAARFTMPTSLAYEAGNLFVLEINPFVPSGRIRKVVIATGVVTTMRLSLGAAGKGDAGSDPPIFKDPQGITSDGVGNLFVVDASLHTVFKVVIATGVVSRFAGSAESGCDVGIGGVPSFCFPKDVISDQEGNLYVADCGYHTIRKVIARPRDVLTIAGGAVGSSDGTASAAGFSDSYRLALDGSGDLFVLDTGNNIVRKIVTETGQVTTLAGTARQRGTRDGTGAAARFAYPRGLAMDQAGDLFVVDSISHTIRKVVVATGEVTTFAGRAGQQGNGNGKGTEALFNMPVGVASDGAGTLFVTDSGNHRIRKIVVATAQVTTFAGTGRDEGNDGPANTASFGNPSFITSDAAGSLFVADGGYSYSAIRRVDMATGEVTTLVKRSDRDGPGSTPYVGSAGLASDGAGNLFVADPAQHVIWRMAIATGQMTLLAGSPDEPGWQDGTGTAARFSDPGALVFDGAGHLYVADSSVVRMIDVSTAAVTTVVDPLHLSAVVPGALQVERVNPAGLALGPTGDLYISDSFEPAILVARF